jgi:L-ascorbate metabolism protein UlaG (beta-lactamase superfamily)
MALLQGQVDLMLVCIGDKFTMGPMRAAHAVEMVRPKMAVPMHYDTTSGQTGTPEQFKTALRKYGLELIMRQMKVGETLTWK